MTQQFAGRTALVTGGGSGIGRATALALAAEGALVTVAGRTRDTLEETVRLVQAAGGAARHVVADVTDESAVEAAVAAAIGDTGRLDIAVNNAGYDGEYQLTAAYPTDMLDKMIAINIRGVFLSMKHELKQMTAQGFGSVVNMSSGAGLVGVAGFSGYTATKRRTRSAGSPKPPRSPTPSSGSAPTRPASSPAWRCRSTAATPCPDAHPTTTKEIFMRSGKPLGPVQSLLGAAAGRQWRLPAKRNRVRVERNVPVRMRDGVTLLADHYIPVTTEPVPTILVRCPYGRGLLYALLSAQLYAERGYHVLFQSTRGTFGSGGAFVPGVSEPDDAQDTVAWLRTQDWFDGRLATAGGSYLGFTQWALAMDPPPELKAMVVMIGVHDLADAAYQQGPLDLFNMLSWADLLSHQETAGPVASLLRMVRAEHRLRGALDRLPLRGSTDDLGGRGAPWYDDWIDHPDVHDPYWERFRVTEALRRTTVPTLLIGGWHDYFLTQTLEQYRTLRSRDVEVALTVGPWTHLTVDNKVSMPQAIAWLDTHVAGRAAETREAPVQVFVGGAGAWQQHRSWPPENTTPTRWYLGAARELTPAPPADGAGTTRLRYDPADPTPSVGGRLMAPGGGAQDNRKLEQRADVLTFTTAPLTASVEVHGQPVVQVHLASDNAHADLFARVCDVDPAGRSTNVTDRIIRCAEADATPGEVRRVEITLDPTAHRFDAGHRIRLQLSGGAFPRFARNPGTGEAPGTATALNSVTHTVHRDAAHPSNIVLPVVN
jgi:putative CocE/NonD family hydrolase